MPERWPHVCHVNTSITLLSTNCCVSTTTNSKKCLVNWIPQRIHVRSKNVQLHLRLGFRHPRKRKKWGRKKQWLGTYHKEKKKRKKERTTHKVQWFSWVFATQEEGKRKRKKGHTFLIHVLDGRPHGVAWVGLKTGSNHGISQSLSIATFVGNQLRCVHPLQTKFEVLSSGLKSISNLSSPYII